METSIKKNEIDGEKRIEKAKKKKKNNSVIQVINQNKFQKGINIV